MRAECLCVLRRLDELEPGPGGGHDVAVGLRLGHLDGLLLLEDEETVELGGGLLLVVVPAQLQHAHRVGAGLGHDALKETEAAVRHIIILKV